MALPVVPVDHRPQLGTSYGSQNGTERNQEEVDDQQTATMMTLTGSNQLLTARSSDSRLLEVHRLLQQILEEEGLRLRDVVLNVSATSTTSSQPPAQLSEIVGEEEEDEDLLQLHPNDQDEVEEELAEFDIISAVKEFEEKGIFD